MEFPSRRNRKQPQSYLGLALRIVLTMIILVVSGLVTYVAFQTKNFLGLTGFAVIVFYGALAGNLWNIRAYMPGLSASNAKIRVMAFLIYACIGLSSLTAVSRYAPTLPNLPETVDIKSDHNLAIPDQIANNLVQQSTLSSDVPPRVTKDVVEKPKITQAEITEESSTPVLKPDSSKSKIVASTIFNGHMIEVNKQTIRLIGVTVPEEYQEQAQVYLQSVVLNKEVDLEICSLRPKDDYDRVRAVVRVNGVAINQQLIALGYSPLIIAQPCSIELEAWRQFEQEAKDNHRGMWSKHAQ